jgi:peptidoglycan hydrolase-like protein with peptidoglycan-binding domain
MSWEYIDGQRVASAVASDFRAMNEEFKRVFPGVSLVIVSGTRTTAEQEQIFRARYVTAGDVRGRRVYDTRIWNGVRWYRVSSAGTVAVPRTSNHEENGPIGPRALDLADTGSDAGIKTAGSTRGRWFRQNSHRWNFNNVGDTFGEGWHKEWTGNDPHGGVGVGGNRAGYADGSAELRSFQEKLIQMGHNLGDSGADAQLGEKTKAATKFEQGMAAKNGYPGGGLTEDGIPGDKTNAYLDWWLAGGHGKPQTAPSGAKPTDIWGWNWNGIAAMLRCTGRYSGNNQPGPQMMKAFQRFLGVAADGAPGAVTIKAMQRWLNNTGRNAGAVDGVPGGQTHEAFKRAEVENWNAFPKCR